MANKSEDESKITKNRTVGSIFDIWPELQEAIERGDEFCDPWFHPAVTISDEQTNNAAEE